MVWRSSCTPEGSEFTLYIAHNETELPTSSPQQLSLCYVTLGNYSLGLQTDQLVKYINPPSAGEIF